jgi:hypothetical protein
MVNVRREDKVDCSGRLGEWRLGAINHKGTMGLKRSNGGRGITRKTMANGESIWLF